jgi:Lrp/AsnC family leucine-responsive transcriptional regulator
MSAGRAPGSGAGSSGVLDDIDLDLVRLLRANARVTKEDLADRVHLSRSAVHERLRRLEERGVIRGYSALVDWNAIGLPVSALIWVRTKSAGAAFSDVARAILVLTSAEAAVEECHRVTGSWTIVVEVHTTTAEAVQALTERIGSIGSVEQTMTDIVLASIRQTENDRPSLDATRSAI